MKKMLICLFAAVLAVSMMGCKGDVGSGSGGSGGDTSTTTSKYKVGDIILNDGTFLRDVTSVSDEDKAKAVAVIYKVDGAKAYGIGLVFNESGLEWCHSSAKGFNIIFSEIQCIPEGKTGAFTFIGDTDGRDNFFKIAQALEINDDTEISGKYPAFEFVENYKNLAKSHVGGTDYENGWYLPTLSELFDIWKTKSTVEAAISLCGGSQFGDSHYWSSSQYALVGYGAYSLNFFQCTLERSDKDYEKNVCCIRVFE